MFTSLVAAGNKFGKNGSHKRGSSKSVARRLDKAVFEPLEGRTLLSGTITITPPTSPLEIAVGTPLDTTTTGVTSTGGSTGTKLSISGSLPPGVKFVDDGLGDGAGDFSGTPTKTSKDVYTVTIKAKDKAGDTGSEAFTFDVDQEATFPSGTKTANFIVGQAGTTVKITSTGGFTAGASTPLTATIDGTDITGSADPVTGLEFTDNGNGTGTLSGTALAGSEGAHTVVITSDTSTETITVNILSAPTITSANTAIFTAPVYNDVTHTTNGGTITGAGTIASYGVNGTFEITTAGGATSISLSGNLPSGLKFHDNKDGTAIIYGEPAATTNFKTYTLVITAHNSVGSAKQTFIIKIGPIPTITVSSTPTFTVGQANSFTITSTNSTTLTEVGALPDGLTFTNNGNGTATISGTPAAGTGGIHQLTFTATGGTSPGVNAVLSLTINAAPTITVTSSPVVFSLATPETIEVVTATAANSSTAAGTNGFNSNGGSTLTEPNQLDQVKLQAFALSQANNNVNSTSGIIPGGGNSIGNLPAGLTFIDNGNGTGSLITPAAGITGTANGVYEIEVIATDTTTGLYSTATIPVTVGPFVTVTASGSSTLTSPSSSIAVVGVADPITFTGVGAPGSSDGVFTITANGTSTNSPGTTSITIPNAAALQQLGMTFTDNGNNTATLSGTPVPNSGGSYPFNVNYTVNTTGATGSATTTATYTIHYTLVIEEAPSSPVPVAATFTVGTTVANNPGTIVANHAVSSVGYPTPTLTETGALPTGLFFESDGNGAGSVYGTPAAGTGGTYVIMITATNVVGSSTPVAETITVNQAPIITTTPTTATFTVGTDTTVPVTSTAGFPASTFLVESGTLPAGVVFVDNTDGTGEFTGIPEVGSGGTYNVTLTAENTGNTTHTTTSFTLTVDETPVIGTTPHSFVIGEIYAPTAVATLDPAGFPTSTITVSSSPSLASTGLAVIANNATGAVDVEGTPAAGTGGTYTLTITATTTDNEGATPVPVVVTKTVVITIDQAPAITTAATETGTLGTFLTFPITTSAGFPPGVTLTENGTLPSGVSLVDNGNGTGEITGIPTQTGIYTFTITAANGDDSDTSTSPTITLTVNEAPVITPDDQVFSTLTPNIAQTEVASVAAGFPALTSLTLTGTLPSGLTDTINQTTGEIFVSGILTPTDGGLYTLTVNASNGVAATPEQVTITVDQPPKFTNTTTAATVTVGQTGVSIPVGGFTTTPGYPTNTVLSVDGADATALANNGLTFVDNLNGTGAIVGNTVTGAGGTYTVTVNAEDGSSGAISSQVFTLTVDQAPTVSLTPVTYTTGITTTGPQTIAQITGAFPATVLTIGAITGPGGATALPSGLIATIQPGGQSVVVSEDPAPAAGTGGVYTVTINASNGVSPAFSNTVTVTVDQAPVITSAAAATFTVGTAGSFTPTLAAGEFPTATTWSLAAGSAPFNTLPPGTITINSTTGVISGTATAGQGGVYKFDIVASNGISPEAVQPFTLTVLEAPAITSVNNVGFSHTAAAGTIFTVTTTGFGDSSPAYANGDAAITIALEGGNTTNLGSGDLGGVSFVDNGDGTASIIYSGTGAAAGGPFTFTITANNGVGTAATQTFSITVT